MRNKLQVTPQEEKKLNPTGNKNINYNTMQAICGRKIVTAGVTWKKRHRERINYLGRAIKRGIKFL